MIVIHSNDLPNEDSVSFQGSGCWWFGSGVFSILSLSLMSRLIIDRTNECIIILLLAGRACMILILASRDREVAGGRSRKKIIWPLAEGRSDDLLVGSVGVVSAAAAAAGVFQVKAASSIIVSSTRHSTCRSWSVRLLWLLRCLIWISLSFCKCHA